MAVTDKHYHFTGYSEVLWSGENSTIPDIYPCSVIMQHCNNYKITEGFLFGYRHVDAYAHVHHKTLLQLR